jgi:chromosome segregation ATPase
MRMNHFTMTRASCRGERREATIERWHALRRQSDVSDRRRDLAAKRCTVTAPPDDVQRSIGHVAERDHVLTTRGNDLASARDDLTSRINDLTSRINDLTSRINDLTSRINDLTSRIDDLTSAFNDLTSIPTI